MRRDPGLLGDDRDVDLLHAPSEGANARYRRAKHFDRVLAGVRWIAIGKHFADVACRGGAKNRVGDCVRGRVTVRVTGEVNVAGNRNATEDERSRRLEAMRIVADTNARDALRREWRGIGLTAHAATLPATSNLLPDTLSERIV